MNFKSLELDEQIDKFNETLNTYNSFSFTKACAYLGIAKSTFSGKLKKNNYKFDKDLRQIIPLDNSNSEDKKPVLKDIKNENKEIKLDKNEDIEKDIEAKVNEMYKWYKAQLSSSKADKYSPLVDKSRFTDDMRIRTFKLYTNVSKELDKFTKKHSQYSIQDIVNTAILDYLERH